jgi:hypothetical protein
MNTIRLAGAGLAHDPTCFIPCALRTATRSTCCSPVSATSPPSSGRVREPPTSPLRRGSARTGSRGCGTTRVGRSTTRSGSAPGTTGRSPITTSGGSRRRTTRTVGRTRNTATSGTGRSSAPGRRARGSVRPSPGGTRSRSPAATRCSGRAIRPTPTAAGASPSTSSATLDLCDSSGLAHRTREGPYRATTRRGVSPWEDVVRPRVVPSSDDRARQRRADIRSDGRGAPRPVRAAIAPSPSRRRHRARDRGGSCASRCSRRPTGGAASRARAPIVRAMQTRKVISAASVTTWVDALKPSRERGRIHFILPPRRRPIAGMRPRPLKAGPGDESQLLDPSGS